MMASSVAGKENVCAPVVAPGRHGDVGSITTELGNDSAIHLDTEAQTLDSQKAIEYARKKIKRKDTQALLKNVGVSTTGKGQGVLGEENRSKDAQLDNAVIVAAIVAGNTAESLPVIPISSPLAKYVQLLKEHGRIEDMTSLREKLLQMPKSKNQEAIRVRDALVKISGLDVNMEEGSEDTNDLTRAVRQQKEAELLKAQKNQQLEMERIRQVKEWVTKFENSSTGNNTSRVERNLASEFVKAVINRPKILAFKAYCRNMGLKTTGAIEELALRVLQPTDEDKAAPMEPKDKKVELLKFLGENHVHLKQASKLQEVFAKALIVAEYIFAQTEGNGNLWNTVPEGLKLRVSNDPPSDGSGVAGRYTTLTQTYPPKLNNRSKNITNEAMPDAPSRQELVEISRPTTAVPSAPSKPRGKRPLDPEKRSKNIKPSEMTNGILTLKKKGGELQLVGGDDLKVVLILQRRTGENTWKHEVVGGRSEEDAKKIVLTTAQIFRHKQQDNDNGAKYMTDKHVSSFTVSDAAATLKEFDSEKSKKIIKGNRPSLSDLTPSTSSIVKPLCMTPSSSCAVQLFPDARPTEIDDSDAYVAKQ